MSLIPLLFLAAGYQNLQVLPQNISQDELSQTMRGFSLSLGVRCDGCHAEKKGGSGFDFAADDKSSKLTARTMLQMAATLNAEALPRAAGKGALKVSCDTCHRGLRVPRTLEETLADELQQHGLDAAIARYRELRREFYGGAQYDFSESTHRANGERAKAIAGFQKLVEAHPADSWAKAQLAELTSGHAH